MDAEVTHIAVCGQTGSGKSSLINSVRGKAPGDEHAAATGVGETTAVAMEYVDEQNPQTKGLFLFHKVVIVYSERLTEANMDVIDLCHQHDIAYCVVGSKSDNYIRDIQDEHSDLSNEQVKERYETATTTEFHRTYLYSVLYLTRN